MDDTVAGIISPAATYPSVPALGFFVDGTKCDSLATFPAALASHG